MSVEAIWMIMFRTLFTMILHDDSRLTLVSGALIRGFRPGRYMLLGLWPEY